MMLDLQGIRLVYNAGTPTEVEALNGLDLTLEAGEFVTVVGTNGAGKSSLIEIIAGAQRPTAGRVRIDGQDVTRQPDYRRARLVARVFDNPHAGTLQELSIADNMALAMSRGWRRRLRFAQTEARRATMREQLACLGLGLERRLADPVSLLSAGQRQSLTMLMAGLLEPRVLLLDEHVAALDPGTQARVLGLTTDLVTRVGCTTVMVTHNMEHAISMGDRLIVMSRARVIADLRGPDKAGLTVEGLVERIVGAGDVVSDRIVLPETAISAQGSGR